MSEHGEDKVELRGQHWALKSKWLLQVTLGHVQEPKEVGSLFPWGNTG